MDDWNKSSHSQTWTEPFILEGGTYSLGFYRAPFKVSLDSIAACKVQVYPGDFTKDLQVTALGGYDQSL